ncbi:MAG: hypothetical protein R2932_44070 [Caldilineaceae bacterium]
MAQLPFCQNDADHQNADCGPQPQAEEPETSTDNEPTEPLEKMILGGTPIFYRDGLIRIQQIANRVQPGYKYYLVDRFGLFDMMHIRHGREQMEEVLREIRSGYVELSFVTQKSLTTDMQIRITGFYRIQHNLSARQLKAAALGIAMDFERLIEEHQSPGSSFSLEDLPSDYIGYFIALHPEWTAEELLTLLDDDKTPTGFNKVVAHLYKSFQRNQEFRPIPIRVARTPVGPNCSICSRPVHGAVFGVGAWCSSHQTTGLGGKSGVIGA